MKPVNLYKPEINEILDLEQFRELDYEAIEVGLPIELMMEQAGFHLANMAVNFAEEDSSFLVGVGPGNNGGGGLVAARRLRAWGYKVSLHLPFQKGNMIQQQQLKRTLNFGVDTTPDWSAKVFIDSYLGFSQKLPLPKSLSNDIDTINLQSFRRISLDLPTGIGGEHEIQAEGILCLAAPKKALESYPDKIPVWIADLGIPFSIYQRYGFKKPMPFDGVGIFQWDGNKKYE